jgi:hypothetical protein
VEPSSAERPGVAPEGPQPRDPAATEAPAFRPTEEGQPPRPGTVPAATTSRSGRLRDRLLRKKILRPVVLALIGVALLAGAIALYTSPGELPTPPYATLGILSAFPVSDIIYRVDQVSPTIAETIIEIELPAGTALPPAGAPTAHLVLIPPFGTGFTTCPGKLSTTRPSCLREPQHLYLWVQPLKFTTVHATLGGEYGAAFVHLFVKAQSFGETFNGVTASAAIPQVEYHSSGTPTLQAQYNIPSASSYDWSAFPTIFANNTYAQCRLIKVLAFRYPHIHR